MVAPNQSGAILCAPETEIPPRNFGGNHPRDLHGKHGKVNNAPVLEIQPEASFAALSGLDFDTVQVFDHVDSKELIGLYFDPYANHAVANIMRKMDYFPCLGLGKNQQGITEIPEYPTSIPLYGKGYAPSKEDQREREERIQSWVLAKKNGETFDWKMRPYFKTLNGYFVKEGADFLFVAFLSLGIALLLKR